MCGSLLYVFLFFIIRFFLVNVSRYHNPLTLSNMADPGNVQEKMPYIQEQTEFVLANSVSNCQSNVIEIMYSNINMTKLCSVRFSRK